MQEAELDGAPHIVVATPGRLLDFVQTSKLSLGDWPMFLPARLSPLHALAFCT